MKSEVINLTSEYTYIRCDDEFSMAFTNGQSISMWRGFYCFRTAQLQEYNTNNQLIVTTNDGSSLWWLCTNTLIMSVTDINNEALGAIGQLVGQIGVVENATSQIILENQLTALNALDYQQRSTSLLESLQNSFSIFLNAYVEANNVTDFGYITGTINNDFTANVFIAKANKYSFNCGISMSYNGTATGTVKVGGSGSIPSGESVTVFDSLDFPTKVFDISISNMDYSNLRYFFTRGAILKSNTVTLGLYDNTNVQQTGFAVSNVSAEGSFVCSGKPVRYSQAEHNSNGNYYARSMSCVNNINIGFTPVLSASYLGGVFTLSMGSVSGSFQSNQNNPFDGEYKLCKNATLARDYEWTIPSCVFSESLSISFDVSKT